MLSGRIDLGCLTCSGTIEKQYLRAVSTRALQQSSLVNLAEGTEGNASSDGWTERLQVPPKPSRGTRRLVGPHHPL